MIDSELPKKFQQNNNSDDETPTANSLTPRNETADTLKEAVTHGTNSRDLLRLASDNRTTSANANPPAGEYDENSDTTDDSTKDIGPSIREVYEDDEDEPTGSTEPLNQDALEAVKNQLETEVIRRTEFTPFAALPVLQQRAILELLQRNTSAIAQMIGSSNNETIADIFDSVTEHGTVPSEAGLLVLSIIAKNLPKLKESFHSSKETGSIETFYAGTLINTLRKSGNAAQQQLVDKFLLESLELILPKMKRIPSETTRNILIHGTQDEKKEFETKLLTCINDTDPNNAKWGKYAVINMFHIDEDEDSITPSEQQMLITEAKILLHDSFIAWGLNSDDMLDAWQESTKPEYFAELLRRTFEKISKLEERHPGICAELRNGMSKIRDFARYPDEMLMDQYNNRNNINMRYGAIFLPYSDWNGAFYNDIFPFKELYDSLQQVNAGLSDGEPKYGVRIFEIGNISELEQAQIRADRAYGEQHKIEFAFIGGHGEPGSIQFGGSNGYATVSEHVIGMEELGIDGRGIIPKYFEPEPTLILDSCSTGEQDGIGERMSSLGAKVIAPEIPTNLKSVTVTRDTETGKLVFVIEYKDPDVEQTYTGGQLM